jgi:hypothetical protein
VTEPPLRRRCGKRNPSPLTAWFGLDRIQLDAVHLLDSPEMSPSGFSAQTMKKVSRGSRSPTLEIHIADSHRNVIKARVLIHAEENTCRDRAYIFSMKIKWAIERTRGTFEPNTIEQVGYRTEI